MTKELTAHELLVELARTSSRSLNPSMATETEWRRVEQAVAAYLKQHGVQHRVTVA